MTNEMIAAAFDAYLPLHSILLDKYSAMWDLCCETASNEFLMNGIQFANDFLGIPPVASFLRCRKQDIDKILGGEAGDMEDALKQAIGAFWGAIFRGILGYDQYVKKEVHVPGINLRTAALFCPQEPRALGENPDTGK